MRYLRKLIKLIGISLSRDRRQDIYVYDWNWPDPIPAWGEGPYVFRNGDWVRPWQR